MRWALRQKRTRRFRSRRAYKQDARQVSEEPWEGNTIQKVMKKCKL